MDEQAIDFLNDDDFRATIGLPEWLFDLIFTSYCGHETIINERYVW